MVAQLDPLKILYDVEYRITSKVGNGIGGRISFLAKSQKELDINMIHFIQTKLGYPPEGYDCFSLSCTTVDSNPTRVYTWQCSASCD